MKKYNNFLHHPKQRRGRIKKWAPWVGLKWYCLISSRYNHGSRHGENHLRPTNAHNLLQNYHTMKETIQAKNTNCTFFKRVQDEIPGSEVAFLEQRFRKGFQLDCSKSWKMKSFGARVQEGFQLPSNLIARARHGSRMQIPRVPWQQLTVSYSESSNLIAANAHKVNRFTTTIA